MSKYICIGTDGNNLLFYNEAKDEFYSAEKGYFSIEIDDDFFFFEEFSSPDQEAKEQAVLITNPHEIKALKSVYESIKKFKNKEKRLKKAIKALNKKAQADLNSNERRKKICLVYSFVSLMLAVFTSEIPTLFNNIGDSFEEMVEDHHVNFQNDEKHLEVFCSSVSENSTMNEKVKEKFNSLFSTFVESDAYIYDYKVKDICRRLKNFNFENYDESNYIKVIPYIIFGENSGFYNLVSTSLSECATNNKPSEESLMFGLLNIQGNCETLTQIFIGGEECYIEELAKCYNTPKEDIKALLNLIILYKDLEDVDTREEVKREYYQKMSSILLTYYRNKKVYSDIDYLVLSSQAFNGNVTINNNIFNSQIVLNINDSKYGEYSLYYEASTGEDISSSVYLEKLTNLINSKGNNLNYNDPDSRFLMYLLYLTYEDSWDFNHYEFDDCQTSEDLARKFMNNALNLSYGKVDFNPAFLYAYLSNGKINLADIISQLCPPDSSAFSVALFKELDSCIRIDLNQSQIPNDDYNRVLTKKLDILKNNDEKLYNLLLDSIISDTSLFEEFKLSPFSYSLCNSDIKKYAYEPK